jgi:molybdate transport system substrate-binding protein
VTENCLLPGAARKPVICFAILACVLQAGCRSHKRETLTISVAASLQNAMAEIAVAYGKSNPATKINFNFGGSGALEQQIEQGAPVDIFFSAAPKPIDMLAAKGLILPDTRRDLLRNQVVLIAPGHSKRPNSFHDLLSGDIKLIALGDPASVPAGDYGRQVLESLHIWQPLQSKLVLAKDVRQVLTYVETGDADAGIVYSTDARESARARIVETAPDGTHSPVVYPIAVMRGSANPSAARTFVAFLAGTYAQGVFQRQGFTTISQ